MDSLPHLLRLRVVCQAAVASLILLAAIPAAVAYEGYGYPTVGGQGGTTYHVTNTKGDTSTGSLRWALSQPSPKIIVFDVGGTITLSASVEIRQSYITIDGTTAPSPGITIRPPTCCRPADRLSSLPHRRCVVRSTARARGTPTGARSPGRFGRASP